MWQSNIKKGDFLLKRTFICLQVLILLCFYAYTEIEATTIVDPHIRHVSKLEIPTLLFYNDAFKNIEIRRETNMYIIQGEVSSSFDTFGAAIEDGHSYLAEYQKQITRSSNDWSLFQLDIPLDFKHLTKLRMLYLSLYILDEQKWTHQLHIPLEYIL